MFSALAMLRVPLVPNTHSLAYLDFGFYAAVFLQTQFYLAFDCLISLRQPRL